MSRQVELDIRYALGHSYHESWVQGELFCPNCGKRGVWEKQGAGDYYVGASYFCIACRHDFTIQGPTESSDSYNETYWSQRYKVMSEPREEGG